VPEREEPDLLHPPILRSIGARAVTLTAGTDLSWACRPLTS
jgi:hypothetical protein